MSIVINKQNVFTEHFYQEIKNLINRKKIIIVDFSLNKTSFTSYIKQYLTINSALTKSEITIILQCLNSIYLPELNYYDSILLQNNTDKLIFFVILNEKKYFENNGIINNLNGYSYLINLNNHNMVSTFSWMPFILSASAIIYWFF